MAKWKLTRQIFGCEEFTLSEGERVTIGRGVNNIIALSSVVISRNHCVIIVQNQNAVITDLQSSNGVYVGKNKIPPLKPYVIEENDVIGLGWTIGAPLVNINDSEKYVFKLNKETTNTLTNRLKFQSDTEIDDIEAKIANIDGYKSPVLSSKLSLKRKINNNQVIKIKAELENDSVINISDSDDVLAKAEDSNTKRPKLQTVSEEPKQLLKDNEIKNENEITEYDAFSVKQEYLGYDDEPIKIDSDSDSESEQWLLRLSQNSPGKPFTKISKSIAPEMKPEDGSYSQLDDDFMCGNLLFEEDDEYEDDIISIQRPENLSPVEPEINKSEQISWPEAGDRGKRLSEIISTQKPLIPTTSEIIEEVTRDTVDGFGPDNLSKQTDKLQPSTNESLKKARMIEPLAQLPKGKPRHTVDIKKVTSSKHKSSKHSPHSKRHISSSQKELRKKKLAELAARDKDDSKSCRDSPVLSKRVSNVKVTTSNRGAFLTDVAQAVIKPLKPREESDKNKNQIRESPIHADSKSKKHKEIKNTEQTETKSKVCTETKSKECAEVEGKECAEANSKECVEANSKECAEAKSKECLDVNSKESIEAKTKEVPEKHAKSKHERSRKKRSRRSKHKEDVGTENKPDNTIKDSEHDTRLPVKKLKPLTDSEDSFAGRPVSKVGPMPPEKPKKSVRFSEAAPQIVEFEIEPGHKMKKTSSVKSTLMEIRQTPVFSLEKITLMKILRWNPQWLEEQLNNNDPPPILGHNNTPMSLFHSFVNHNQYVQFVGDLLLMEIWECITIAYMKIRNQSSGIQMRVETIPVMPTQERCFDLFNLCVSVSLLPSETRFLPRVGEVMLVTFGPVNAKNERFFFVHNVRQLPAAQGQTRYFYSISLHATMTDKMLLLKPGETIIGKSLAYINNELMLFEAMEYLAGSPLSEAILRPEPHHFVNINPSQTFSIKSQWTITLNPSQLKAVHASVAAALSDKPSIQMVQGPPGTGKSSVICAIVMTYFYNAHGKKQQNRGKILICATSNAAVDGLVIRLLHLRQSLPKPERFRMVRVGRAEAMHPVAADVSSQQLATRDLTRLHDQAPTTAGLNEEISHLEAKINSWKTAAENAKDPVRVAYCQTRVNEVMKRMNMLRGGAGGAGGAGGGAREELRPEQLARAERRIIEGADIVVTTLSSAQNHKMRGLKRRIALCIIDEAGQVIEPETLIPLTLDVTRLTLIGDPQQLPGFICSQRAKKHGLSESLFSRLTSCADQWPGGNPVVLLNQQYRMHPDIADYPSRAFYGGMIESRPPMRPNINLPPYNIISISSGDKGQGSSGANEMEAWGVTRLVLALDALLRPLSLSLAVITPYNAHKELIKKHLKHLQNQGDSHVEVNTVDSFQGQERDVVVVSLARSQGVGFLTDTGRMNVMLTRAKHALFICLNPFAMLKNNQWRTLIEDAQRRNLYKTLPNIMCQPIDASQISSDDIIKYITNNKSRRNSRHVSLL